MQLDPRLVVSPLDSRDYQYIARVAPKPFTDLSGYNVVLEDQKTQGTCGSNAYVNTIETLTQRAGQYERLSRQFCNHVTQKASGLLGREGVYSARDVLESMRRLGICLESEHTYGLHNKDVEPGASVYASAETRKLTRYEAIDISKSMILGTDPQLGIDNINSALAEGLPVMLTLSVGEKFMSLAGPLESQNYYPVDLYFEGKTGNKNLGLHCVKIDGNNDAGRYWKIENSYNKTWGDNGYGRIPYDCIRDFFETWVVRGYKDLNFTDQVLYEQQMQMVKMYVAVLGRPPELGGFKYWLGVLQRKEDTLGGIAQGMMLDAESRARFPKNGDIVVDMIFKEALFANRVAVASYCALDLACDNLDIAKRAFDLVTPDPASVDVAKKFIRSLLGGGVL